MGGDAVKILDPTEHHVYREQSTFIPVGPVFHHEQHLYGLRPDASRFRRMPDGRDSFK